METAPATEPRERVQRSIQSSAAGPGASNTEDSSRHNPDLPPLPLAELDISGFPQASSPATVTNTRTDQNSESFERDSELSWFEDGNVVVVAQNTAFRLHKSVVSLHSSVFRDLCSMPQPYPAGEGADETFDGCPVIRVSDTSYDFRELLRAIHHSIRYLNPNQTTTSPVLFALARLSHKYQFDELFAAVIYRLEAIFPTRLDVWDRSGGVDGYGPNRLSSADAIEALNLFRLIDRPDMVPTALYRCAQLEPHAISHRSTRADGVTRERLSRSDMGLCIELKGRLLKTTASLLTRLYEACDARLIQVRDSPDCPSPGTCGIGLCTIMGICLRDLRRNSISTDPLDMYYISVATSSWRDGMMCRVCGNMLVAACSQERRKIWRKLPGFMGVIVANWDSA